MDIWVVKMTPESMKRARIMVTKTTMTPCQYPWPSKACKESPTSMPKVTPMDTSRALRICGSRPKPKEIKADVAAKYGSLCPKMMAATAYAATAAIADVPAGISAFRARHSPDRRRDEKKLLTFCQPVGSGGNG